MRLLQLAEMLHFILLAQVGMGPFGTVTREQTVFLFGCGRTYYLFYSWSWRSTAHFNAVVVVVTYGHSSDDAASSIAVDATVLHSANGGELPCSGVILPVLLRLVSTLPSLSCVWYCPPPPREDAARFGAVDVDMLCDPLLRCPLL